MAGTVTVACKLPMGLLLRLYEMVPTYEPVLGGGVRETAVARRREGEIVIQGTSTPHGKPPRLLIGGYAMTPGVDEDFFNEWMKQNEGSDLVRNCLIFAQPKLAAVEGQAKENAKTLTGMEPIDTDSPHKRMGSLRKEVKLEKAASG